VVVSTVVVDVVEELVTDVVNDVSEEEVEEVEVWDVSDVERDVIDTVVVVIEVPVVDCADVEVDAELVRLSVVEEGIDVVVTDVKLDSMEELTMETEEVGISVDVATDVVAWV